jgi:hypothetical protein
MVLPKASALGKRLPHRKLFVFSGQTVLQLGCSCASRLVVEAFSRVIECLRA